jgi:hypothetical protein
MHGAGGLHMKAECPQGLQAILPAGSSHISLMILTPSAGLRYTQIANIKGNALQRSKRVDRVTLYKSCNYRYTANANAHVQQLSPASEFHHAYGNSIHSKPIQHSSMFQSPQSDSVTE